MEEIINKVEQSDLITFNLEDFHTIGIRKSIDISQFYSDSILKEKQFRETLKNQDWSIYKGCLVNIYDSTDSIIPAWAFLLISVYLSQANFICFGNNQDLERELFLNKLFQHDFSIYQDRKVILKGCSKYDVPTSAYVYVVQKLKPIVSSLMYGEPCSTVPLFKRK